MGVLRSTLWDFLFYRPSRYWLLDPELDTEEIVLKTHDNKKLVCLYIHTQVNIKRGVIFMLHGRGGNAATYARYAKPLVEEGFDVFITGLRGFGKSQGRPNHTNVVKDTVLALDYFLSLKDIKHHKKILWGLSLGGQTAIHLAGKYGNHFDALVTEGAVASFDHAVLDYYPGKVGSFFKWFTSAPYSAARDIETVENLPKLIIHSRDDQRILPRNADLIYNNAREPKFRLTIEGNHLHGLNKVNSERYIEAFKMIAAYRDKQKKLKLI